MSIWSFLFIFLNIACVGALIYLIILLVPKREIPASKAFIYLSVILILWLITLTNQVMISFSETQVIFMNRLSESIFLFLPIALIYLADKYATVTRIMQRWVYIMFGIALILILGIIWTNQYHHLFWQVETIIIENNQLKIMAQKTQSAMIFTAIQHLSIAFATFHFLNLTVLLNRAYRRLTNLINISLALTTIFSAANLLNSGENIYNFFPVFLTAFIVSLAHLITEHKIFDLALTSRITYFHELADGAMITSTTGTVLDVSKQIETHIGPEETRKMIGTDILERFPKWKTTFQEVLKTLEDNSTTISFHHEGNETQYDITMHPNKDMYGYVSTILIKFTDVTFYRQLLDQLNELAIRDPLTGILNRRHFELLVMDHLKLAQRYRRSGCLMMLDLDNFKHVNDFYGHLIGDKALIEFCSQMNMLIRQSDIFARYGGDEFVLYLPETDLEGALVAVNNMKKFIIGSLIDIEDLVVPIKCTVGLIPITEKNRTLSYDKLIKQADDAMYAAKDQDANIIGIYSDNEISFHTLVDELPERKKLEAK